MTSDVAAMLARIIGARPDGGENRPGQVVMAEAVAHALEAGEHLLVEAPTGVGKSLAYLVPGVLFAQKLVVVTATKGLQEQLTRDDLPTLAAALEGKPLRFAMLKGRSNYLCRAKLDVTTVDGVEARLDFGDEGVAGALDAVKRLADWADSTETGDRADAPGAVSEAVWSQVSVDPGECPGAANCHAGDVCFAEAARDRAEAAEIVVVNTHLYAAHLASGGNVLPPHTAVVFDEAHTLEDTFAGAFGVRLTPYRVRRAAARAKAAGGDADLIRRLDRAADALDAALGAPSEATRVDVAGAADADAPADVREMAAALVTVATLAREVHGTLRKSELGLVGGSSGGSDVARAKAAQATRLLDGLADDIALLLDPPPNSVAWIESNKGRPELHQATVDVGPALAARLYPEVTVIATSATLATGGRFDLLARRLGLTLPPPLDDDTDHPAASAADSPVALGAAAAGDFPAAAAAGEADVEPTAPVHRALTVPSPFDHARQGWLYVAKHLPEPNDPRFGEAMADELHALITAAGGRTLALFTSRAAMDRTADALAARGGYEVLVQDRLPRPELLARFRAGPGSALFATQGFWQGVDLPGHLCRLVAIDRIPFPRPTDPLVAARRAAATARRENDFAAVDLPAAATLLAQGAGRLIRTTTDSGVVAVFDRRLATKSYRQTLLATLPPLRRTIDQAQMVAVLSALRDAEV
ncbi:MAG TPA: ATP-dependent DNA helicase [Acidimicrobiia bacterium]|nr:ATP-dependent DNA helicase [Acidimicrobiia bacterium]